MGSGWWALGVVGLMFGMVVLHALFPQARRHREYWARQNGDDVDPRYWKPRRGRFRDKRHYPRKRADENVPE